jgi:hypothetical protein
VSNQTRLSLRAKALIERCQNGDQRLRKSFRLKATGDTEILFLLEPSGPQAGPSGAQEAIASGLLKPLDDGLFDASNSQTWTAK